MFGVAGLRLTSRLRRLTMSAILRQEMAFFDDPANSVGALCSRLASDSSNIHGVSPECGEREAMASERTYNVVGVFAEVCPSARATLGSPAERLRLTHLPFSCTLHTSQACGPRLGTVAQAVSTLVFSITVSVLLSWRLALVLVPFVPLVLAACYLQTALTTGQQLVQMHAVDAGSGVSNTAGEGEDGTSGTDGKRGEA